jgi:hypothetical protein
MIAQALSDRLRLVEPVELRLVKPDDLPPLHTKAAIGGGDCGPCGGFCDQCMPDPILDRKGGAYMDPTWKPTRAQMSNTEWVRVALAKGCLQDLFSPLTTVAAGGVNIPVTVEPSQRACFVALKEKIVVISDLEPLTSTVRALFARAFAGDCPVDFQNQNALTDFKDTDDCAWCPIPETDVGRVNDNTEYSREFTNLSAAAAVRVQIAVRGIPYPDRGCWRGYGKQCACG